MQMNQARPRRVLAFTVLAVLAVAAVIAGLGWSSSAGSAVLTSQADPDVIPKASISLYISPSRITTAYLRQIKERGRILGADIITPDADGRTFPHRRASVILQFGYQEKRSNAGTTTGCYGATPPASCRWGVVLQNYTTRPWYPNAKVRAVVLAYAQGFFYGTKGNPDVFLSLVPSVSNDGHTSYESGRSWADTIVDHLNADFRGRPANSRFKFSQQIHVNGGCDCELRFDTPATTLSWIEGFKENLGGSALIDYGDCEGCDYDEPYDAARRLPRGWTIPKVFDRVMADRRSRIIPQIYADNGVNAKQWGLLSKWAWTERGRKLIFRGSLAQRKALIDCNKQDDLLDNTPDQAYTFLWRALNDPAWAGYAIPAGIRATPYYSSDITWQPC